MQDVSRKKSNPGRKHSDFRGPHKQGALDTWETIKYANPPEVMVEAMAKEGPDHKAPSDGAEGNGKKRRDVPGDLHLTAWIMLNIRRLLDLLCLSSPTCLPTGCSGGVIRTTSNRPSQEPGASSLSALLLYLSLFLLLLVRWMLLLS